MSALAFVGAVSVYAEEGVTSSQPSVSPIKTDQRTTLKDIKARAEMNKDVRNTQLGIKKEAREDIKDARGEIKAMREDIRTIRASSTDKVREIRKDIKEEGQDFREGAKMIRASSTDMFKRNQEMAKNVAKKMKAQEFEARKNALLRELNMSLNNLANISTRIESRIVKVENEGKTMTDARALLVTAKDKLAKAKLDVEALKALQVPTQSATSTVEVDLIKPRVAGDTAIKSVKDARDAFQKVVVSIAHSLGNPTAGTKPTTEVKATTETN